MLTLHNTDELKIAHSGSDYYLKPDGSLHSGGSAVPKSKAKEVLEAATTHVETNAADIKQNVMDRFSNRTDKLVSEHGFDKTRIDGLKKNLDSAKIVHDAADNSANHIKAVQELHKNPSAEALLSEDALARVYTSDLDLGRVGRYGNAQKTLEDMYKGSNVTEKTLRDAMLINYEHLDHLPTPTMKQLIDIQKKTGDKLDFSAIQAEVKSKVSAKAGELEPLLVELPAKAAEVERLLKNKAAKPADLDAAKKAVTQLEGKITAIAKETEGAAAFTKLHFEKPDVVKNARKISTTVAGHVDGSLKSSGIAAVTDTAKKGFLSFTRKSEEKLIKLASEKGKAVSELGVWARTNTGTKIGVGVGAVIVLKAITAAVGKKGKAADMNQEQQQAQLEAAPAR